MDRKMAATIDLTGDDSDDDMGLGGHDPESGTAHQSRNVSSSSDRQQPTHGQTQTTSSRSSSSLSTSKDKKNDQEEELDDDEDDDDFDDEEVVTPQQMITNYYNHVLETGGRLGPRMSQDAVKYWTKVAHQHVRDAANVTPSSDYTTKSRHIWTAYEVAEMVVYKMTQDQEEQEGVRASATAQAATAASATAARSPVGQQSQSQEAYHAQNDGSRGNVQGRS